MTAKHFEDLNLSQESLAAIEKMGFTEPTSVQLMTIPPMLDWRDVIAKAPTGTGKTCAFGIPIMENLDPKAEGIQALILSPTRELALQISDDLCQLAITRPFVRIVTVYGGQPIDRQIKLLRQKPQIVIATPGRLLDHLKRRTIRLDMVKIAVLDEADRMLDMGFIHDVRKILDQMPKVWQIAMFSATLSRSVMDISWIYQRDVVELTVDPTSLDRPDINQYAIEASGFARISAIKKVIRINGYTKVIVFCNTIRTVRSLTRHLQVAGCQADCLHGDLPQSQRERIIRLFRSDKLPILVATDVASRGLDIEQVDAVFNYEIPDENDHYIHRIGRTGRARQKGASYTFVNPLTRDRLGELARLTGTEIRTLLV